ncbi:ribosomal protein S18-alanine N-acetyltransferase [Bacillus fonticola]|uniref:ribosomal protein S18-alanine N-acetyltransferase n=1 Tax=Bacillus fonticola TaxID=2728853 RepID=UPI0014748BCB|nr:ribosomal protein S18-alanine N-acetyltransferase [Bacillus fonticola]
MEQVSFRWMTLDDVDEVLAVEQASFSTPWKREAFVQEIQHNMYAEYLLLCDRDKVIGYCGMWLVVDEAHITNIAVLPSYRGRGMGRILLQTVLAHCVNKQIALVTLEVRVSNEVAQSLYRSFGFEQGGIRKNYYTDNQEDARVMWVRL